MELVGITDLQHREALTDIGKTHLGVLKILYACKGTCVEVDFETYSCEQDTLFFFNEDQLFGIDDKARGELLYFHGDFYCIEIHDKELACDGILYSNVLSLPQIGLGSRQTLLFTNLFQQIKEELINKDMWSQEKIRILIKFIMIESTRLWVSQSKDERQRIVEKREFTRRFSQLVDKYYASKHKVSDYAALMNVSTATLNKRISSDEEQSPSCIIVGRIMLEAKRLLVYTDKSVKEIAHSLGYIDTSYFNRYFKIQSGCTPLEFRDRRN
ncbi:helix-turn-helix domain-containing protein [Myroides pelagicus]|uniref:Helix-turn-helix domain-containing protein n=1 Tax=Myroides pelagicus TaxID=270914 RepID=A0A7K1GM33_9FLAO|nr:helix-turn-helix domain-containing protein [Myroides pelagicus]MTH29937.1 helix-turn-helix domain-containing protein [Myroides pelagicus]